MSWHNDGGQAFPTTFEHYGSPGMTLRDYFAAKAMSGIWASVNSDDMRPDEIARLAYKQADAMLAERERQP